ncbi:ran-binding protein 1 homolog c-like [Nymphaea colorata]|nr:ran-binding protein 1 homolog c-like [Nymphaea colorata]
MAPTDPERNEPEEETAEAAGDDEDTGAVVQPIVKLEEVAVTTGEEDEEALFDVKAKLYRFDKEGNQWKERGVGSVKLLKHKETGKVRLVMRQSKTLKICANHLIFPTLSIQEHVGNDKSCVWHAPDFADGELKDELFCIRFGSVENCKKFMEMVQEIAESMGKKGVENKDAAATADLLDKLSVGGEKKEAESSSSTAQESESKPSEPAKEKEAVKEAQSED